MRAGLSTVEPIGMKKISLHLTQSKEKRTEVSVRFSLLCQLCSMLSPKLEQVRQSLRVSRSWATESQPSAGPPAWEVLLGQ